MVVCVPARIPVLFHSLSSFLVCVFVVCTLFTCETVFALDNVTRDLQQSGRENYRSETFEASDNIGPCTSELIRSARL